MPEVTMVQAIRDALVATVVGFDYPAFEAAPPANVSPKPVIVGANGQADLTQSPAAAFTY